MYVCALFRRKIDDITILMIFVFTVLYAYMVNRLNYSDYWWHTSLSFVAGIALASKAYKLKNIIGKMPIKCSVILSLLLFSVGYVCGEFVFASVWIIEMFFMAVMVLGVIYISYIFPISYHKVDKIISVCGNLSLEIYLAHVGIMSFCFSEGYVSVRFIMYMLIITFGVTITSHMVKTCITNKREK